MDKIYSLQWLRFIAAAFVANHHLMSLFPTAPGVRPRFLSGAAGVDVFFVISGIVIGLCLKQNSFHEFIMRRLIRIFPVLWIGTALFIMAKRTYGVPDLGNDLVDVAHSLMLWPSQDQAGGRYGPAWTLQYELAFYLLSSLVIVAIPARDIARVYLALVLTLAFGTVHISRALIYGVGYFDTSLFLKFASGLVLSLAHSPVARIPKIVGVVAFGAAILAFAASDIFPGGQQDRIISWGVPSVLMVFAFLNFEGLRFFKSRAAQLLGAASYVIYMTHLSVIQTVYSFGLLHGFGALEHPISFVIMTNTAIVAFGVLVHQMIEKPLLKLLRGVLIETLPIIGATRSLTQGTLDREEMHKGTARNLADLAS